MKRILILMFILTTNLYSEVITITGHVASAGEINGVSVVGQSITAVYTFADGNVFQSGLLDLGDIAVEYTFSGFGVFTEDVSGDSFFGNPGVGFQGLLGRDDFSRNLGGDNNEIAGANENETLADYFARVGDGTTINFTGDVSLTLLPMGDMGNGGVDTVTDSITINTGDTLTLTLQSGAVPEPSTYLLLSIIGLGIFIRQRKLKRK